MSDDADRAGDNTDKFESDAVEFCMKLAKLKPRLIAAGFCHYCGEKVQAGYLFCDKDCQGDWEHEQERRKANGC